ncbi:hypothetical protein JTB14_032392 [Gonioctena quinquepunctata]|nr:hypothetical protein JTB14_032392 [Gonioctena quinquepunctata]
MWSSMEITGTLTQYHMAYSTMKISVEELQGCDESDSHLGIATKFRTDREVIKKFLEDLENIESYQTQIMQEVLLKAEQAGLQFIRQKPK